MSRRYRAPAAPRWQTGSALGPGLMLVPGVRSSNSRSRRAFTQTPCLLSSSLRRASISSEMSRLMRRLLVSVYRGGRSCVSSPCLRAAKIARVDSEDILEVQVPGEPASPQAGSHPAWRRVQLARHPKRPHSLDYIERIFTDFQEFHGDRAFGDDPAIVAGSAQFA